jgi:hypothetical protein
MLMSPQTGSASRVAVAVVLILSVKYALGVPVDLESEVIEFIILQAVVLVFRAFGRPTRCDGQEDKRGHRDPE